MSTSPEGSLAGAELRLTKARDLLAAYERLPEMPMRAHLIVRQRQMIEQLEKLVARYLALQQSANRALTLQRSPSEDGSESVLRL